jgi:hypothetical protein
MSKAEKFIQARTKNGSNQIINGEYGTIIPHFNPWLTPDQALRAVEIAREEELEYVKYKLELRLPETLDYNGVQVDREDFINDFIKTMRYE